VNHQTFERILRLRDIPGGMRDGVLVPHITPHTAVESAARMLFPASLPRESRGRRAVVLRSAALTYDAASRTDRGGVV
jgi:hypothetical protein